jgi:hypothetical protein
MRYIKLVACLVATLCTAVAFSLAASAQTDVTIQDSTSSPVAYAYVSSATNQNTYAFSVASDGKLTPVSGSPFATGYVASMAVNAKYLRLPSRPMAPSNWLPRSTRNSTTRGVIMAVRVLCSSTAPAPHCMTRTFTAVGATTRINFSA